METPLEWQDIVALVALSGYGLHRLRKVLTGTGSRVHKAAHAVVHVGAALTGAVLVPSPVAGLAFGLAGAGAVQFVDAFIRARVGAPSGREPEE